MRFDGRGLVSGVLVTAVVGAVLIALVPHGVVSADMKGWEEVGRVLDAGQNPYQVTTLLNWGPFWLQIIYVLQRISDLTTIPLYHLNQLLLLFVECLIVLALGWFLDHCAAGRYRWLPMVGIGLAPVPILLTVEHGNFDVFVALWVLLAVISLDAWLARGSVTGWLLACLFIGLAVLTKTVPLVLAPLLVSGFKELTWKTRGLGAYLLLGPVMLGVSTIYVQSPTAVSQSVIQYRSSPGWFGLSGLLQIHPLSPPAALYSALFLAAALVVMASLSIWLASLSVVTTKTAVALALLLLAAIPGLGPGYGAQYIYWFWPLIFAAIPLVSSPYRWVLAAFCVVASMTYLVEYAIIPTAGAYLSPWVPEGASRLALTWSTPWGQTMLRLPLFGAYIALLVGGTLELRGEHRAGRQLPVPCRPRGSRPQGQIL